MSALFAVESNNGSINCTGNCYEPIANAGNDANYYQGSTALLDGSASYDPDDINLELDYIWTGPESIQLINSTSSIVGRSALSSSLQRFTLSIIIDP